MDRIYGSSEDRTIKVWETTGVLVRELKGHGHWVNTIALNTDYLLFNGCLEHNIKIDTKNQLG